MQSSGIQIGLFDLTCAVVLEWPPRSYRPAAAPACQGRTSAHQGNDDDGRTAVCPRERFVTRQCRTSNVEHLSDTPMATRSYLHGLDMHINAYGDIRPHPEVVGTAPEVVRK